MNVTILNGALCGDSFTDAVVARLSQEYADQGARVTEWRLRDHKMAYCLGCFECWTHTPGVCRIDDDARTIVASLARSDLRVDVTRVTFGGYSSQMKKVIDRSICLILPFFKRIDGEVHHVARYDRAPRLRVVGVLPESDPEQEATFRRLVGRNAINMHTPSHSVEFVYSSMPAHEMANRIIGSAAMPTERLGL